MTPVLTLDKLACVRGGRMLFKGVSLALNAGGALVVRGPNGVGKSSLLRVIAGLLPAYSGSVLCTGRTALADEMTALDSRLPLARALLYWACLDGGGKTDVASALRQFDLTHLADVPVHMLSTGQRRRATMARVAASRADVWLLDEPGNGLDMAALQLLETAMAEHRARGGIVVAASHQSLALGDSLALTIEAAE